MSIKHQRMLTVVVIVATILSGIAQFRLPDPLPASAAEDVFSAGRAAELLRDFADVPRPIASDAHDAARDYLVEALTELGLDVHVQQTVGSLPQYGIAGNVENVVARLPGTESSGALLLIAHYDTVPVAPGAGDAGSGIAVILETLRAVQTDSPLTNDLIVLFTDAEEAGTLGSRAFAAEHPWMQDVQVVLNIEGVLEGATLLIESGENNGWFVDAFAQAVPQPYAYSWVNDIYGSLPMMTDFAVFKDASYAGADLFALAGGNRYHTPIDDLEHLDQRSMQHHGEQTLALVQLIGNTDLTSPHSDDVVYFTILGKSVVRYPEKLAIPFMAGVALLFVIVCGVGLRRRHLTWKGIGSGVLALLGVLVVSAALSAGLWWLFRQLHQEYTVRYATGHSFHANDGLYLVGFFMLTLTLLATWYGGILRKLHKDDVLIGAQILLLMIAWLTSALVPGSSYLFVWPLFSSILVAGAGMNHAPEQDPVWRVGLNLLSLVFTLWLWIPFFVILFVALGLNFLPVFILLLVLLCGGLLGQLVSLFAARDTAFVGLGVTLIVLMVANIMPAYNAEHLRPTRIRYFLDADSGDAYWLTDATILSEWEAQFAADFGEVLPWSVVFPPYSGDMRRSPAPFMSLVSPKIELSGDTLNEYGRMLQLRITPTAQSHRLVLSISPGIEVANMTVQGVSLFDEERLARRDIGDWLTAVYFAPSTEGLDVELEVIGTGDFELIVAEINPALPETNDFTIQSLRADEMCIEALTMINQRIEFPQR